MKGLLLAGGHGTRLRPLTFTGNKHMLPIANRPMLLYGLDHLKNAGIQEIGIILGPVKEGVVETLGDGSRYGVNITYIDQPEPKGLAHAVLVAEDYLRGEPFVMYLGDNLLKEGAEPMVELFVKERADCVIGVSRVQDPSRYGVVVFKKDGIIDKLAEKPSEFISDWALIGVYVFNETIFKAARRINASRRGELEITDAIQTLLTSGSEVLVHKVEGWWKDTGKPEDLLEANQLVLQELEPYNKGAVEENVSITNSVAIGEGTLIHHTTTIRGPVIIGQHCHIGPNANVGPYTSIGNEVTVRNAKLENSILMDGTYIDCRERITDSLIGRRAKILSTEPNLPKRHRLILGDMSTVTI